MPAIVWSFEGDTADLEKALALVQGEATKTDAALTSATKEGTKGFGAMEKEAKRAALAISAGFVAAAASAALLAREVVKFVDRAGRLVEVADQFGTTAEELQRVEGALVLLTDGSAEAGVTIKFLNKNLADAADGAGPAADAFAKLGLRAEDLIDLPVTEQLARIGDAMPGLASNAERTQVALALLGRAGSALIPAFKDGGNGIREATALVEEHGIISNQVAAESEALGDQIKLTQQVFGAIRDQALIPLVPAFAGVVNAVRETANEFRKTGTMTGFGETAADVMLGVVAPAAAIMASLVIKSLGAMVPAFKGTQSLLLESWAGWLRLAGAQEKSNAAASRSKELWAEAEQGIADLGATQESTDAILATFLEKLDTARRGLGATKDEALKTADAFSALGESTAAAVTGAAQVGKAFEDIDFDAIDAPIDESLARFSTFLSAVGELAAGTVEVVNAEIAGIVEETTTAFQDFQKLWGEGLGEIVNSSLSAASEIFQAFSGLAQETMRERISAARETAQALERVERKITETTDEQELERLGNYRDTLLEQEKAQKAAALKSFKTQKALSIVAASMQTALAIINAIATAPNIIVGFVLAGVAAALGLVQIGIIAAKQPPSFHGGGVLRASDVRGSTMDSVAVQAKPGEGFLSTTGVATAGGEAGVNALNAGRGGGGGGQTVNLFRFGTRTTEAISHQQLRSRTGRLAEEFRGVRPKVGRSIPGRR